MFRNSFFVFEFFSINFFFRKNHMKFYGVEYIHTYLNMALYGSLCILLRIFGDFRIFWFLILSKQFRARLIVRQEKILKNQSFLYFFGKIYQPKKRVSKSKKKNQIFCVFVFLYQACNIITKRNQENLSKQVLSVPK